MRLLPTATGGLSNPVEQERTPQQGSQGPTDIQKVSLIFCSTVHLSLMSYHTAAILYYVPWACCASIDLMFPVPDQLTCSSHRMLGSGEQPNAVTYTLLLIMWTRSRLPVAKERILAVSAFIFWPLLLHTLPEKWPLTLTDFLFLDLRSYLEWVCPTARLGLRSADRVSASRLHYTVYLCLYVQRQLTLCRSCFPILTAHSIREFLHLHILKEIHRWNIINN